MPLEDSAAKSSIAVATTMQLGLKTTLFFTRPWMYAVGGDLPDMSITQTVTAVFEYQSSGGGVCLDTKVALQNVCTLVDGDYVGWGENYVREYLTQSKSVGASQCFSAADGKRNEKKRKGKRQNQTGGSNGGRLPSAGDLLRSDKYNTFGVGIMCGDCGSCTVFGALLMPCCGCVWLPPE